MKSERMSYMCWARAALYLSDRYIQMADDRGSITFMEFALMSFTLEF